MLRFYSELRLHSSCDMPVISALYFMKLLASTRLSNPLEFAPRLGFEPRTFSLQVPFSYLKAWTISFPLCIRASRDQVYSLYTFTTPQRRRFSSGLSRWTSGFPRISLIFPHRITAMGCQLTANCSTVELPRNIIYLDLWAIPLRLSASVGHGRGILCEPGWL